MVNLKAAPPPETNPKKMLEILKSEFKSTQIFQLSEENIDVLSNEILKSGHIETIFSIIQEKNNPNKSRDVEFLILIFSELVAAKSDERNEDINNFTSILNNFVKFRKKINNVRNNKEKRMRLDTGALRLFQETILEAAEEGKWLQCEQNIFAANLFADIRDVNTPLKNGAELTSPKRKLDHVLKQLETILKFPANFIDEMVGNMALSLEFSRGIKEKQGGVKPGETWEIHHQQLEVLLIGEIFETIARIEFAKTENKKIAKEIVNLWQNPESFGLEKEIRKLRNPDLAYIEITSTGELLISAVGEVKGGKLNTRAMKQLQEFRDSAESLVKALRKKDVQKKLRAAGLDRIANNADQVKVKKPLNIELILPSQRRLPNKEKGQDKVRAMIELINVDEFKDEFGFDEKDSGYLAWEEELENFISLLFNDDTNKFGCEIKILQSVFSSAEMWRILPTILDAAKPELKKVYKELNIEIID